ncbi:MAG: type II toxin-antitoxin system VapB family antitoxin [Rhodanobacteraceae bacterium]
MRTTITLDDELLKQAEQAIATEERSVVIHEVLRALIQREAARRLARLGGSDPHATLPPRRRQDRVRRRGPQGGGVGVRLSVLDRATLTIKGMD